MYTVKIFAKFRQGREKEYKFNLKDTPTGIEVLDHLDIDPDDVAIYLIDGFKADIDETIPENAIVSIFPPVGGG